MSALLALFVNPWFLIGLPTAAIPVILHLIHQRRAPVYQFSTLRFLKISHQKTARRKKIYDRLLLLLRALLFALLAIGLAQPFLRTSAGVLGGRASTAVVIVFDRSYSMGRRVGDGTGIGRAKQAAEALFEGMDSEDIVSVVTTPPVTDEPESRTSPGKARQFVRRISVSNGRAEMGTALSNAFDLLRHAPRPVKEVYVLTDRQRNSWDVPESVRAGIDPEIPVVLVDCVGSQPENLAILEVRVRGRRRVIGVPVTIEARLRNFTGQRKRPKVSLFVDRQKTAEEVVEVAADGETTVHFTHAFETEGSHSGFVLLPDDDLEADNRRFFGLDIQSRLPVLLVRGAEGAIEVLDPAFYLGRALDPYGPLGMGERSILRTDRCLLAEVDDRKLGHYAVVFLTNCREVPPGPAEALRKYVETGGGLIIFLHGDLSPDAWNSSVLAAAETPLLPVRLGPPARVGPSEEEPLGIREPDLEHPVLQPFKGESRRLFRQIRVESYVVSELLDDEKARVVLRLTNGAPLLFEGEFGQGRIFLWTIAATTDSSNLPVNNIFLPLMHQSVYHLSGTRETARDFIVGHPARLTLESEPPGGTLKVVSPSKKGLEAQVIRQGDDYGATVVETEEPGVYESAPAEGERTRLSFVVNLDPLESELAALSEEELASRLPSKRLILVERLEELGETVQAMREGVQLWNFFLVAVVLLALTECFVANKHTLSRGSPAAGVPDLGAIKQGSAPAQPAGIDTA